MTPPEPQLAELVDAVCSAAAGVRGSVAVVVSEQVDRLAPLVTAADRRTVVARAIARLDGLDALELHLADPDVDEVMVNAGRDVWIDRGGRLEPGGCLPPGAIAVVLERALAATGRRLDRTTPIVDVRLPGGARLCAVADPIAVDGYAVAIRRHRARAFSLDAFAADPVLRALLGDIVGSRCNVLVSGATPALTFNTVVG